MTTVHLDPASTEQETLDRLLDAVRQLLRAGKPVAVMVVEEDAEFSPSEAGQLLGFSRQHVYRLIEAGELQATQLANSSYWRIPRAEVEAFEQRRVEAERRATEFSQELDRLGAPLE